METPSRIFLIGPMGAGKSSVARELARRLAWDVGDSDAEVQARTGVDIGFIFEKEGEAGFRLREHAALRALSEHDRIVIATGGGIIVGEENRALMRERGLVLLLDATIETQVKRTRVTAHRPALQVTDREPQLREMYQARAELYQATAHLSIATDGRRVREVADELMRLIEAHANLRPI